MMPRPITGRGFSCRALNESEPKAKHEFSANGTCALSEDEPKEKSEVSAAGRCRACPFSKSESKPKAPFELSVNHTGTLNESKYKKKGMYYVSESINEPELCGQGKRNEEILGRE